jgi:hypothetical protein
MVKWRKSRFATDDSEPGYLGTEVIPQAEMVAERTGTDTTASPWKSIYADDDLIIDLNVVSHRAVLYQREDSHE